MNAHELFGKISLRNGNQLSRDFNHQIDIKEVNVGDLRVMALCRGTRLLL